ncbi:hypothetical protein ONZ45_g18434 [Pleurotus djamor]|nr:hypothetical protein ONZ45_g18434 [Pleurotus djamor]
MRPIISYDDISLPYEPPSPETPSHPSQPPPQQSISSFAQAQAHLRPPKKRKRGNNNQGSTQAGTSNDNALVQSPPKPTSQPPTSKVEEEEEEEESRDLTHEEIWDDSALIEAWNAATEEYENYHGPEKDWKKEPVHKSPLWYNVPPKPSKMSQSKAQTQANANAAQNEENSTPVDFDAFVPTHDPTLGLSSSSNVLGEAQDAGDAMTAPFLSAPGPLVSRDDAFSKALGAMYWAGYWTAAYHYSGQNASKRTEEEEEFDEGLGENGEADRDADEVDMDLLPTQR